MATREMRGVRGAVKADENSAEAILAAARKLFALLVAVNEIDSRDICSVILSATKDLNSVFPAVGARQVLGAGVPLLCCSEIDVPGAMSSCIRVLILWNTEKLQHEVIPVYLPGTERLIAEQPPQFDADGLNEWVASELPRIKSEMQKLQERRISSDE